MLSDAPGIGRQILASMGLLEGTAVSSRVFVARSGSAASPEWKARVDGGAVLVLEGESSLAEMFGFRRTGENVLAASVADVHDPALRIVWEQPVEMPRFSVPPDAVVFARERWSGAPLVAGFRRAAGAVLWVALPPGKNGYERFPFIPQALVEVGVEPPFRSARLWAFFDHSYRARVDLDYFAERWQTHRDQRAARCSVAFLRGGAGAGCVPAQAHGGMPPAWHPGLCLAGVAARQRGLLEGAPRMAGENGDAAGCAARLAQVDEPAKPGLLSRSGDGRRGALEAVRLGRHQLGRTVLRIARGPG